MLPTAGLFLPEALHRVDGCIPRLLEDEAAKVKSYSNMGRPKQEPWQSEDRTSTTSSRDAVENGANIFTSLATAFNFADFVVTSNKASTETIPFANLIHAVRQDLTETSRLYLSPAVSNFIDAWPDKRAWIESTLLEVRRALNDIGMDMDTAHQDNSESEAIISRRKFDWTVTHQRRLSRKQQQLHACHHNLSGAIHVMQTVELCGLHGSILQDPIYEAPVRPWVPTDEKNASRGLYSRKRYRGSQTNLSMSSVNMSETDKDGADTSSVHSTPVELPGCIPVETTQAGDWNLRISPNLPSPRLTTLRRSRALSSHVRPPISRSGEAQPPSHVVTELSTRKASPVQRTVSTTSTLASINTPVIARRYRAYAVDVYPQREKHRSLSSELPRLRHQSSLMNDLEGYVLPSAASEKLPSREWPSLPVSKSRAMSVAACPDIPEAEPNATESIGADTDADSNVLITKELTKPTNDSDDTLSGPNNTQLSPTNSEACAEHHPGCTTLSDHVSRLQSSQSLIERKPVPITTRVDRSQSLPTIPTVKTASISSLQGQINKIEDDDVPLWILRERLRKQNHTDVSVTTAEEETPNPTPRADPLTEAGGLVQDVEQASSGEAKIFGNAAPAMIKKSPALPKEDMSPSKVTSAPESPPMTAPQKSVESVRSTSSSKPMSAQARRRVAHSRRMEIAFGKA